MYKLFRDATRYIEGRHKKDLGALNRDLRKVILVDYDEDSTTGHRDNALVIKKWEGDNTDTTLIGLTQLLMGNSNCKGGQEQEKLLTRLAPQIGTTATLKLTLFEE